MIEYGRERNEEGSERERESGRKGQEMRGQMD